MVPPPPTQKTTKKNNTNNGVTKWLKSADEQIRKIIVLSEFRKLHLDYLFSFEFTPASATLCDQQNIRNQQKKLVAIDFLKEQFSSCFSSTDPTTINNKKYATVIDGGTLLEIKPLRSNYTIYDYAKQLLKRTITPQFKIFHRIDKRPYFRKKLSQVRPQNRALLAERLKDCWSQQSISQPQPILIKEDCEEDDDQKEDFSNNRVFDNDDNYDDDEDLVQDLYQNTDGITSDSNQDDDANDFENDIDLIQFQQQYSYPQLPENFSLISLDQDYLRSLFISLNNSFNDEYGLSTSLLQYPRSISMPPPSSQIASIHRFVSKLIQIKNNSLAQSYNNQAIICQTTTTLSKGILLCPIRANVKQAQSPPRSFLLKYNNNDIKRRQSLLSAPLSV
ncbi:unnamed protein product [Didymodactylos carnosus]|uniref:Uncharacterized protein n=1 Tax=Didymodactylos carnosus TaxID=1234261 RepID=A0A813Y3R6_9BILA|nr:unnamed protein product [Didymodactylos carnosus]CAF3666809.1 unnamed protein product [Didymodactylos carnosus]